MGLVKSKLKRRLRKKYHLGEFQEFVFEVTVNFKRGSDEVDVEGFLDDFIDEIEKNKLSFTGVTNDKGCRGWVASAKKFVSPTEIDRQNIKDWLLNRPEVLECETGEFLDAWNDPKWNE